MSISVSAARLGCGSVGLGSVGLGSGRCGRAAFRLGGSVPAARLGGLRLHVFGLGALGWLVRLLPLSLGVTGLPVSGPAARAALDLRRCSALSERLGESGGDDLLLVGAGRRLFERSLRS